MSEAMRPWGLEEKEAWFAKQTIQRSYEHDVLDRLRALPVDQFHLDQYGALSYDSVKYPLYRVLTKPWNDNNPAILITGGVHGYEPSGITSALRFLEEKATQYANKINFVVYPCVSPLGYEIDHRWNRKAEDPNRHFTSDGIAEESVNVMQSVESLRMHFRAAIDLHETNQRDIAITAERRARDGEALEPSDGYIPEGFYLYIAAEEADAKLGPEIIEAVKKITQICTDKDISGDPCNHGIITVDSIPSACQSFAKRHADIAMTTEIYPDKAQIQKAEEAQLATIHTVVKFVLR